MNEKETYDVSKLKFDVDVAYECGEGVGSEFLEDGTYEEAIKLFQKLESKTFRCDYYHYMSISIAVYDENDNELDLGQILDGDYEWVEGYSTSDKTELSDTPELCLQFLKDLKNSGSCEKARDC